MVVWTVIRNAAGTPQAFWRSVPLTDIDADRREYEEALKQLVGADTAPVVIRQPRLEDKGHNRQNQFLAWLQVAYPAAVLVETTVPTASILRGVLTEVPLSQWYELAVLRASPTGQTMLSSYPLFPPGAAHGDIEIFNVRCDAGIDQSVSFAVVSSDTLGYHLVSVESGQIPRGEYALRAVLTRPGVVRFEGLPAPLSPDPRNWSDIIATIPDRLTTTRDHEVHLVCLIETAGSPDEAAERAHLTRRLIHVADHAPDTRLLVSLISYGTHSFARARQDEPLTALAWAACADEVLSMLGSLEHHSPSEAGYPDAARLECALALAANRITGEEGRPVLVVVGSRRPFPCRIDFVTEILPCPFRNDWVRAMVRLGEHSGLSVGAVTDNRDSEVWRWLGRDASQTPAEFDAPSFAAQLGLLTPTAAGLPFPLVETGA